MKKILVFLAVILDFLVSCDVEPERLPKAENQEDVNQEDAGPVIEPQEPSEEPSTDPDDTVVNQRNDQKYDEIDEGIGFAGITKQQCVEAGGYWNECGSPCAGTDADFCIQMCQVQCECDDQEFTCPEGFKCRLSGKIADEMGICIKK